MIPRPTSSPRRRNVRLALLLVAALLVVLGIALLGIVSPP